MNNHPSIYALLIGIDQYDPRISAPILRGCVFDAIEFEGMLQNKFSVPSCNILKLINHQATRDNILQSFRYHLINNAQKWKQLNNGSVSPEFIFHFSGHGSQAVSGSNTEPDGMDETLVAYDSRLPGVFDIKDWELGQLIEELNKYTDSVTIILDCCHSGSGTRDFRHTVSFDHNTAFFRQCPPDLRTQPAHRLPSNNVTRGFTISGWDISGKHVLMAGCRDKEVSYEYLANSDGQQTWRGAMTFFLIHELMQIPYNHKPTYRELHERVSNRVNSLYANQMPQCEGDIQRQVFGLVRPVTNTFFNVITKSNGLIWIDGGVVHGISEGSQLKVYSPEMRLLAKDSVPLETIEVVEEGTVQSGCLPVLGIVDIPLNARCVVDLINYGDRQFKITLEIIESDLYAAVQKQLQMQTNIKTNDVSRYIKLVDVSSRADLRIVTSNNMLQIQDNDGRLLVAPFEKNDLDGLANDLTQIVRYHNSLNIRNRSPHSELVGQISLTIKKLMFDSNSQYPIAIEVQKNQSGEFVVNVGERVVFEIANNSDRYIYFALLDFSADYSIVCLYPKVPGSHESLAPGHTFHLGLSRKRSEQISAALPEKMLEAKDTFKIIATVADTNFDILQQGPLKSPFSMRDISDRGINLPLNPHNLLAQELLNSTARAFATPQINISDEWTTVEINVITVQSLST